MFRLTQFTLLVAAVTGFTASMPASIRQPFVASPTARGVLSESETELVLKHANDCIESECAIDEVAELVTVLKSTEKELEDRLEKIMNMVSHLQHINEKKERKTDEVRAFVKDLLRVFDTEKPTFSSRGFTGDVGKGPTTAYDALPPKKWKATP